MKRVNYIKKIMTVVFLVLFLTVLSINYIFANTAAPTNEQVSEPTEVPNIISSIGDFKLKAQYEDKRNVSENLAINVKKSDINSLSPQIIQSIRAQQGDKDIFLCFELELQMNGRKVLPDTTLDIEIENTDIFGKYQKMKGENRKSYPYFKVDLARKDFQENWKSTLTGVGFCDIICRYSHIGV